MYILFSSQIALHVDYESYGLIFGFNTLIAVGLQCVITAIINSWLDVYIKIQVSQEDTYINCFTTCPVCIVWFLLLHPNIDICVCWNLQSHKIGMVEQL